MRRVVDEMERQRALAEQPVHTERERGERPVETGIDEITPITRSNEPPPIEVLDQRVLLDDENVVVSEAVAEVVDVDEESNARDENWTEVTLHKNKTAGPASKASPAEKATAELGYQR
jgi:hypothetical protein